MKPKSVLFVATPGPMGGSNVSLVSLMNSLTGQLTRILAAPEGPIANEVRRRATVEHFVSLGDTSNSRGDTTIRGVRLVSRAFALLFQVLKLRLPIDVIHANGVNGMQLSALTSWALRIPVVVWVHDSAASRLDRLTAPIYRLLLHRPTFVAVSPVAARVITELGFGSQGQIQVITNPVEPDRVVAHPVASTKLRISYLGGATAQKGFDVLVETIELARHLPVVWQLFIRQGSGGTWSKPYWERISSESPEYVEVLGRQPDVRTAYACSDIVFTPSRLESFGMVAAESMMNGIPVVASDIEAFRSLLGSGQAGLLFSPGTPTEALAVIERLARDQELRDRLGAVGRERAKEFHPNQVAAQMLATYEAASSV